MVSVEYPPIKGGIGCYTYNLTKNLSSFLDSIFSLQINHQRQKKKGHNDNKKTKHNTKT